MSYNQALNFFKNLKKVGKQKRRLKVLKYFSGKVISLGLREKSELICHSALLIQPWGEIETVGSIIKGRFRGRGLMKLINQRKRKLLEFFAKLNFQLTSYAILGSSSIQHGCYLFDFPQLNLISLFCNFGPFVYKRPINVSRSVSKQLLNLSIKTPTSLFSSSVQVIGIKQNQPPYLDQKVQNSLPISFVPKFPFTTVSNKFKPSYKKNASYSSPANIDIYMLRNKINDLKKFHLEIVQKSLKGKSIILRIPLIASSQSLLKQINHLLKDNSSKILPIPTGFTVFDNHWHICFSTISKNRLKAFTKTLNLLLKTEKKSLKKLANCILDYLKKMPDF